MAKQLPTFAVAEYRTLLDLLQDQLASGRVDPEMVSRLRQAAEQAEQRARAEVNAARTEAAAVRTKAEESLLQIHKKLEQAEVELRQREEYTRRVIDNTLTMVGVMTPDGTLIEANATALRAGGLRREEVEGKKFWECYWWSYDVHVQQRLRQAVAKAGNGESMRYDEVVRTIHDSRMTIDFMLVPVRSGTGQITHLISSAIDITERKQSEEDLRRTCALIEGLTTGTDDLIAVQDGEYRYLFFNEAYRREFKNLWGEEIGLGTNILEALASWPKEQRKYKVLWSRALSGESFSVRMEFGPSETEKQAYDLRFHPIYDPQGQQIGAAHILRNVTEDVRMQQALRSAKEAAEEASRAKDTFLINMSHELRTPLTVNMGMLELAKLTGGCDEQTLQYLDKASCAAESLLHLIENILELRSLQEKTLSLAEAPFNLVDCCREVLNQLIAPAEKKGLEVTVKLDSRLPHRVVGDCDKVREILFHLIGNAVKFTEQGRIEISVCSGNKGADGQQEVHFEIRDTGIGIPAEKLRLIFQPFSQADASLTRRYGGAGLGLAISRELIEHLGGKLEVLSGPEGGSVFSFMLSFATVEESTKPTVPQREPSGKTPVGRRGRILVVEDDPQVAMLLRMFLTRGGYDVEMAEHGRKALEVLEQEPVDLILMDLKMPVMDGYEATHLIRQREQWQAIPIIALTSHARPQDKIHCLSIGMNDFLTKPMDMQKLCTKIESHLSSSLLASS
jgi:PAS domain S-box-containing protein